MYIDLFGTWFAEVPTPKIESYLCMATRLFVYERTHKAKLSLLSLLYKSKSKQTCKSSSCCSCFVLYYRINTVSQLTHKVYLFFLFMYTISNLWMCVNMHLCVENHLIDVFQVINKPCITKWKNPISHSRIFTIAQTRCQLLKMGRMKKGNASLFHSLAHEKCCSVGGALLPCIFGPPVWDMHLKKLQKYLHQGLFLESLSLHSSFSWLVDIVLQYEKISWKSKKILYTKLNLYNMANGHVQFVFAYRYFQ